MEFTTVKDVEILATGTYQLGSGEATFTPEHLKAAALATTDPTVVAPRIGIGHTDPRFADDLDGEPALGVAKNLRVTDDGHKLLADFENVPAFLAEMMPSAYPSRSIEGAFDFKAASGHEYPLAISAVKLLGQTWPGVTSLADLQQTFERNGEVPEAVAASEGVAIAGGSAPALITAKAASRAPLTASFDVRTLPRTFVTDLKAGKVPSYDAAAPQEKWWARQVEASEGGDLHLVVDDQSGHLLRIPITVGEEDSVEYGTPVAASGDDHKGLRVLASWPVQPERVEAKMHIEPAVLRKRLGLAEDADEAAITAALEAEPPTDTPAASSAPLPAGTVLIDEGKLRELEQGAQAGTRVAASLAEQEREGDLDFAINDGRIAASRREHFRTLYKADPEGTKKLLTAKADEGGLASTIPTEQREIGASGDGDDASNEDALVASYEARFFPEIAKATTNGGAS